MDLTSIIFDMASEQNACRSCGNEKKLECILCAVPLLGSPDCSVAEKKLTIRVAGRLIKELPVAGTGILGPGNFC